MAVATHPQFWEKPLGEVVAHEHWKDPFPKDNGMLRAELITKYVAATAMIEPFQPAGLKPSSYRLTLGRWAYGNGKAIDLIGPERSLHIPSNSIVFVTFGERIRLPHYVAARFNLSIEYVYKGLLLGTGPQVDPGWHGVLSCPLHNLSNQEIEIRPGQHLATIDFEKTSPLDIPHLHQIADEDALYDAAKTSGVVLYEREKRWPHPIVYQSGGTPMASSSVAGIEQRLGEVQKTVEKRLNDQDNRISRFRTFASWAAAGLAIALFGFAFSITQSLGQNVRDIADVRVGVAQLQQQMADQLQEEQRILACLKAMQASGGTPGSSSSAATACSTP